MKTIILPGFPEKESDWAFNVAGKLDVPGEVWPVIWNQPKEGGEIQFDPNQKVESLISLCGNEEVNLIAKARGILVAVRFMKKAGNPVKKLVLCGIPIKLMTAEDLELLKNVLVTFPSERLFVLQNSNDPNGSEAEVTEIIHSINPSFIVAAKEGSNSYPYFDDIGKFLA